MAVAKLSSGKSPGHDGITTEHLLNCHPILFTLLAKLFNLMTIFSYVPLDFCKGITVPIPKNESLHGVQTIDSFRGITLSPVLAKVFEHCILLVYSRYLYTSSNQFGFKAKVGCTHSIYAFQNIIDYYVLNESTVNICFMDVSKAFDKINHAALLLKLMQRRIPCVLIKLLLCWYKNSNNVIRWGEALSAPFSLKAGVRQGSVISPALFSIYVDDMLNKLGHYGCRFYGLSASALMYADDLVLLSPSCNELQTMINVCCEELALLDLNLNNSKSTALRIGPKCNAECQDLCANGCIIKWKKEAKYLGMNILHGYKFSCNFDNAKSKFYRAANCIFGKLEKLKNLPVTLHLEHSIAFPVLTCGLEAIPMNKTQLSSLEHPWSRIFMKILSTFDQKIVQQCQLYSGLLPLRHYYMLRRMRFLSNILSTNNCLLRLIFQITGRSDIVKIANNYHCVSDKFKSSFEQIIRSNFKTEAS